MTPMQMRAALDHQTTIYENVIDDILEQARQKYVIPFCNKHNYKFTTGMGSWILTSIHGKHYGQFMYEDDFGKLPKKLVDVLTMDYPLNRGQSCGSMMQNYTPKSWKTND